MLKVEECDVGIFEDIVEECEDEEDEVEGGGVGELSDFSDLVEVGVGLVVVVLVDVPGVCEVLSVKTVLGGEGGIGHDWWWGWC